MPRTPKPRSRRMRPLTRGADTARGMLGAADLLAPRVTAAGELGGTPTAADLVIYRILGARQIVQATVAPTLGLRDLGMLVDGLHIATMIGVLVAGPRRWRRAAILQIGVAGALIRVAARAR